MFYHLSLDRTRNTGPILVKAIIPRSLIHVFPNPYQGIGFAPEDSSLKGHTLGPGKSLMPFDHLPIIFCISAENYC